MTNPAGQTALSHSELTQLATAHDEAIARSTQHSNNLLNALNSELMPGFKGGAAAASAVLTTRIHEDLQAILADMQAMADNVRMTSGKHLQNDEASQAEYNRLLGVINNIK
jgi:hypothetical protein